MAFAVVAGISNLAVVISLLVLLPLLVGLFVGRRAGVPWWIAAATLLGAAVLLLGVVTSALLVLSPPNLLGLLGLLGLLTIRSRPGAEAQAGTRAPSDRETIAALLVGLGAVAVNVWAQFADSTIPEGLVPAVLLPAAAAIITMPVAYLLIRGTSGWSDAARVERGSSGHAGVTALVGFMLLLVVSAWALVLSRSSDGTAAEPLWVVGSMGAPLLGVVLTVWQLTRHRQSRLWGLLGFFVVVLIGWMGLFTLQAVWQGGSVSAASPARPIGKAAPPLSQASIDAAKAYGGVSHKGEQLYVLVMTRDASETVAARRLAKAVPHLGDAQNYFVVVRADSLKGLEPGGFVVVEAYRGLTEAKDSAEFWGNRVGESWYRMDVVEVTVLDDTPLPVVEDIVPGLK